MRVTRDKTSVRVRGTASDVDTRTVETIRSRYAAEDELKLLREAIMELAGGRALSAEFDEYARFVSAAVEKGKRLKK